MTGLMVQLDRWRHHFNIPRGTVAAHLGVSARMPEHWAAGRFSPPFPAVVGYASLVRSRVVLTGGRRILAEGMDIVEALPRLRRESKTTYAVLGARIGTSIAGVAAFGTKPGARHLATVERYAGGLGLWLEAIPLVPGTGNTEEGE